MSLLYKIYPVTCSTHHVGPGSTFVAIDGFTTSGLKFIPKAIKKGATTILVCLKHQGKIEEKCHCVKGQFSTDQNELISRCSTCDVEYRYFPNPRLALAIMACSTFKNPSQRIKLAAVTGTKGKTTTASLVEHILKTAQKKTALISSLHNSILDKKEPSSLTTPTSDYINFFLDTALKKKVSHAIIEASSHGIAQHRLYGIKFDVVGFNNLGHDHLDFHKTQENYFNAKTKLFNQCSGSVIINTDDAWGRKATTIAKKVVTFGTQKFKSYRHTILNFDVGIPETGLTFSLQRGHRFKFSFHAPHIFGEFNVYNAAMAALICESLGIHQEYVMQGLKTFPGIDGRMQQHKLQNGAKAFIDFAHNPDSIKAVLKTLRPLTKHLVVLFGAGGNRDKEKRPKMGEIAEHYADVIILTSDNPRDEAPEQIIKDVMHGICNKRGVHCCVDRSKAIIKAVKLSFPESLIAILGKGSENVQIIGTERLPFSDFEHLKPFFAKKLEKTSSFTSQMA